MRAPNQSKAMPTSEPSANHATLKVWIVVSGLLLAFAVQNIIESRRESCTSDELIKLTAGYTYLLTDDFRLNMLHPPLLKMFSAIPLLVLHPKIDLTDPNWSGPKNQWKFSANFLYSNNADQILFWGRLPVVFLTTLLGFFIFRWAQQLYGNLSGVFALTIFTFSPTFIAHSHWVTLDAGVASLLTISFYLLWRYARLGMKPTLLCSALFMGAALGSKYLAFAMLPGYAILLWIIYRFDSQRGDPLALTSTEGARRATPKGIRKKDPSRESHQRGRQEGSLWKQFALPMRSKLFVFSVLVVVGLVSVVAILAYFDLARFSQYFRGLAQIKDYKRSNFPFYLHGDFVKGGAWYFFLVTFLIKATASFVILVLLRFIMFFRKWRLEWVDSIFLVLPAVVYFVVVSAFANPIGVRYLLPVFSLFMIFSSGLVNLFHRQKIALSILWILLGWHITSSLMVFPHHLSYFNEFVGGPSHGTDWLDDSNVDWGQELKGLKKTLDERGIQPVTLIPFSPYDNPEYYGIRCIRPPQKEWPSLFEHPQPGAYAISAHWLARAKGLGFDWKFRYPVLANVGNSMFVFHVQ